MDFIVRVDKRTVVSIMAGILLCLSASFVQANIIGGYCDGLAKTVNVECLNNQFLQSRIDLFNDAVEKNTNTATSNAHLPEPSTLALLIMGIAGSFMPFARKKYNELRRGIDIIISLIALIIASPILLIAALLVKLDSSGPVFYKQIRVGVNRRNRKSSSCVDGDRRQIDNFGKPFTIYKLRTMRTDAESKTGAVWAQKNDNRITRIGKFLRKTRLDEIPQFINVLQGEMSIVGPRPERPEFVRQLNNNIRYYYRRFHVKPGITGLAQTRFEYASSIEDTRKKLKYDLLYVKKMCLYMDVRIYFNTVRTILFTRGAR